MAQTDKMLARKEGGVGIVTFNYPERHNAVSLEMWEATKRILDGFAADNEVSILVKNGRRQRQVIAISSFRFPKLQGPQIDVREHGKFCLCRFGLEKLCLQVHR